MALQRCKRYGFVLDYRVVGVCVFVSLLMISLLGFPCGGRMENYFWVHCCVWLVA